MDIIFNVKTIYNNDIAAVLKLAQTQLSAEKNSEVYVNFVTDTQIRELNRIQRDNDSVTDVLTFPFVQAQAGYAVNADDYPTDINPQTGRLMLGEIYLSRSQGRRQAKRYGHSQRREMAYLALHGFLHILGYDHEDENTRSQMRAAEESIMQKCGISRDD